MNEEATEKTIEKTIKIAGVRFRENWKVYDFDANDIDLAVGDRVIVDSERGPGFASVVRIRKADARSIMEPAPTSEPASAPKTEIPEGIEIEIEIGEEEAAAPQPARGQAPKGNRKVLRRATNDDIAREEKNREREAEAFSMAQDMITEREMAMKLIRVEYSFDASRATFFFFSENRIDFRELVKDLAYKLKSRIEMRQIGVRDVARMIGGFGPCGRELCCSSFLKNFEPVSIRMAKKQEMVLNPAKISGVCGRLLCCLSYEYGMYEANKKDQADLRQTAVKEKKQEEELLVAQARKEAETQRQADEKKRQEERQQQRDKQRDKQKEGGQKGGKPEKKKEQQEKKAQGGQGDQQRQRQQQPRPDRQQQAQPQKQQKPQQAQQAQQAPQQQQVQQQQPPQPGEQPDVQAQQQDGEKSSRRKRRRFWRKKKKPGQGGENQPPPAPQSPQGG